MKKRWTVCYIFLDTSTAIKSAGVLTRQIDFSIPLSARNSLPVAHAKLFDKTNAHHRQIHSFSRGAFLYHFVLKIGKNTEVYKFRLSTFPEVAYIKGKNLFSLTKNLIK